MNKNSRLLQKSLLIAGLIELIAGLSHAVMPCYIFKSVGFSLLQPNEIDTITLSIFSVGILLVAFGVLTIIFSSTYTIGNIKMLFYFVTIKSILWAVRIVLEFFYPTQIAMFSIEQPVLILIPIFIIIDCLFIFSGILIFIKMKKD